MTAPASTFAVLLACSNAQCERFGKLDYYFTRANLSEMSEENNQDTIMCPACGETRKLTADEKSSLRKFH
jgi:hypothetical protein